MPLAQSHLRKVRRATESVDRARDKWVRTILAALDSGESLRDIAPYAGVSYSRLGEIVRKARRELDES